MRVTKFLTHAKQEKIKVQCILILIFVDSKLEEKDSAPNDSKHSMTFTLLLISA